LNVEVTPTWNIFFITEVLLLTVGFFFFFFVMPGLPRSREETYLALLSFHLAMASRLSLQPRTEVVFSPYLWKCMFLITFSYALVYKQIENNSDPSSSSMKESQTSHREEDEVNLLCRILHELSCISKKCSRNAIKNIFPI
jgi:hypothetical protein